MRSLAATISLKVSAILPVEADLVAGQPHREIADPHRLQRMQQFAQLPGLGGAVGRKGLVERGGSGGRTVCGPGVGDVRGMLHRNVRTPYSAPPGAVGVSGH